LYKRDGECLLRDTGWVFKYDSVYVVFKELMGT